jgi:glycosyltransferase involved in cell wall biosynthesis
MKRILSFTDYYWPGYKAGGTIRAFLNQVDYLKEEFEFHIVTRNTDYTETAPYPGITPGGWTTLSEHVHVFYADRQSETIPLFRRLIRERSYDVVYIHLLFGFRYSLLPLILAKMHGSGRIIIASHGVLGAGALGIKSPKKKLFLTLARLTGLYRGTVFHSVTPHETEDIRTHIGKGVKISEARELPRMITTPPVRKKKVAGELNIVTVARIAPEKNQLFALEILAACTGSQIRYDLIGPVYDETYWSRCREVIGQLPPNITVRYRGSIPSEQIPAELQSYDAMLLTTTGENFGHTILESFMAGTPVIISDRTPWRNLEEAGTGRDIPLEKPQEFVRAVEYFASLGPEPFDQYASRAFAFARDYISSPEMLAENINLFNS